MRNPSLWARLQAYEFDKSHGSAPYSVKLARAEGWSTPYTARVIEEYRRFLYLSQVSDAQVTPCQVVDAAWHMHLTFTRDYWDELCPNVIGAPVHHQPCAGAEEMPRYNDQFAATKALYAQEFGSAPPEDIWARPHAKTSPPKAEQFALSEAANFTGDPLFIALIPFVISLIVFIIDPGLMIGAIVVFTGVMALVVFMERQNRRRRRNRRRRDQDDGTWLDDEGYESDGTSSSSGRDGSSSGSTGSKHSHSESSSTGSKAASGGFFANLFDGDSNSDGDGGGCGGCGN